MTLLTGSEREDLRGAVRGFLAEWSPTARIRGDLAAGVSFDRDVWRRLGDELGLLALPVAPVLGGDGGGLADLVVVMEELGRALYPGPYLSSVVLACRLLQSSGRDGLAADLGRELVQGGIAAVAIQERDGGWQPGRIRAEATRRGDGWAVTGEKSFVLGGSDADVLLVVARSGGAPGDSDGLSLYAVRAGATGLEVDALEGLDLTRQPARVRLSASPAQLVGVEGGAWDAVQQMLTWGGVALAGEQAGGARRCLELSVDHARTRVAFGRVIGGFQAVKHRCAEMWRLVQAAEAAARQSAAAYDAGVGAELDAAVARAYCSDAFVQVAGDNVHVHGGMGFTWEHDAHLYFRRARSSAALLGSADEARAQVLDLVGL